MASQIVPVNVDLDRQTDAVLRKWAKREDRSKRRQIAVVMRKLVSLLDSKPEELKKLGLLHAEG